MISTEQIKQLAHKHQTTEINILREYYQHLFLSTFYQKPGSNLLLFKGGTSLKLVFNSPRFSEDLDFDYNNSIKESLQYKTKTVESLILNTINDLSNSNININLHEAKSTSGGYLSIIQYINQNQTINIKIEVSFRNRQLLPFETVLITSDIYLSYTVNLLSRQKIVDGKLNALITRGKPRDYFDLYFLLRAGLITSSQKSILSQIIKNIPQKPGFLAKELIEFLPRSYHPLIKNFPSALRAEASRYIKL